MLKKLIGAMILAMVVLAIAAPTVALAADGSQSSTTSTTTAVYTTSPSVSRAAYAAPSTSTAVYTAAEMNAARAELASANGTIAKLQADLESAKGDSAWVRTLVKWVMDQWRTSIDDLTAVRKERDDLQKQVGTLTTERDTAVAAKAKTDVERDATNAALVAARAEVESLRAKIVAANTTPSASVVTSLTPSGVVYGQTPTGALTDASGNPSQASAGGAVYAAPPTTGAVYGQESVGTTDPVLTRLDKIASAIDRVERGSAAMANRLDTLEGRIKAIESRPAAIAGVTPEQFVALQKDIQSLRGTINDNAAAATTNAWLVRAMLGLWGIVALTLLWFGVRRLWAAWQARRTNREQDEDPTTDDKNPAPVNRAPTT